VIDAFTIENSGAYPPGRAARRAGVPAECALDDGLMRRSSVLDSAKTTAHGEKVTRQEMAGDAPRPVSAPPWASANAIPDTVCGIGDWRLGRMIPNR